MESLVLVEGGEAALDRRLVWTDTWALTSVCDEVRTLGSAHERGAPPDELLRLTHRALGYYRGPLLAGETRAWIRQPQAEYRDALVRLVTTAAQAVERAGRLDEAIDLYLRAGACEPGSEPLCYRLMLLLNRADRVAEVIEAYQRHRTACEQDPDSPPPSAQIRDLYRLLQSRLNPESLDKCD
jgi:DNA-binding SARP family transcriptional activator